MRPKVFERVAGCFVFAALSVSIGIGLGNLLLALPSTIVLLYNNFMLDPVIGVPSSYQVLPDYTDRSYLFKEYYYPQELFEVYKVGPHIVRRGFSLFNYQATISLDEASASEKSIWRRFFGAPSESDATP